MVLHFLWGNGLGCPQKVGQIICSLKSMLKDKCINVSNVLGTPHNPGGGM